MKKIRKIAALAIGAALASQAAQAQVVPGDLVLAFSSSGVANDYITDLGSAATLFSSTSVVNLSGNFNISTFNTAFSSAVNPVTMAAVGGQGISVGGMLYTSAPSTPATIASGAQASGTSDANGLSLGLPTGLVLQGNSQSWTSEEPTFANNAGVDPRATITGSTIVENVYAATGVQVGTGRNASIQDPFTLEGYLTLDLNSDTLSFTSENVAVPEPATYGVLAGAGLLALVLRRQLRGKTA